MKTILKIAALTPAVVLLFLVDVPPETPLGVRLVPEAHAILGVWRRHARRWAVVGTAAAASAATATAASESAAAQQQAAAAQQQAAAAQQRAAAAPPPPPATGGKPLPLGTVVSSLPSGCTSTPVGGVDYFYCGGNFYRAVFQGNQLVYVTAKP
jgi:hypothetical protein